MCGYESLVTVNELITATNCRVKNGWFIVLLPAMPAQSVSSSKPDINVSIALQLSPPPTSPHRHYACTSSQHSEGAQGSHERYLY